jgi:DNA helicase INO80
MSAGLQLTNSRGTIEERIVKLARAKKDVSLFTLTISPDLIANNQVQDIVVGTKSLTDVAKPSEIVSLFMDDEELAESVAKRKQAEAHGYVAPTINQKKGLGELQIEGEGGDDEDDFFSLKRKVANGEDEDVDVPAPSAGGAGGEGKKSKSKRKAEGEREFTSSFPNIPCGLVWDGFVG